jgi:hypothetical protein
VLPHQHHPPQTAAMLRMFNRIALSGSSSERKALANKIKVVIAIRAMSSGKSP